MMIYDINALRVAKKVIAKGKLKGTGKSQEELKVVNEVEQKVMATVSTTVKCMSQEEYSDMMSPLLNIFRAKRGVK